MKDCKSSSLQNKPCMSKWNINDNTNWATFNEAADKGFRDWDSSKFSDIQHMWSDFKSCILNAGVQTFPGRKLFGTKK